MEISTQRKDGMAFHGSARRAPDPGVRGRLTLFLLALLPVAASSGLQAQSLRISSGRDVLVSAGEAYPHVEPHLAVDPTDSSRLVGAAMTLPVEGEGFVIRVYRSDDQGASWTAGPVRTGATGPGTSGPTGAEGDDPWLAFGPDGTLYLVHLPGLVWRSPDRGRTWQAPAVLPQGDGEHFDAPKLAVDRSGGPAEGRVYVAATQTTRSEGEGSRRDLAVLRSSDGGDSFDPPRRIQVNDFANKNGEVAVLPDGTVLALWHELFHQGQPVDSPRLWSVRSRNGGRSFSIPSLVTPGFLSLSPAIAVDRSAGSYGGRTYAVWLGLGGDRNHYVAHSDDAGATWSEPLSLTGRSDTTVHPTPVAAAVGPRGTLGVLWAENLTAMGEDCFEMRFAASPDGGGSFSEPAVVADEPSCSDTRANRIRMHSGGPRGSTVAERFQAGGDYFGLVPLPDGSFRVMWADARNGPFQLWTDRIEVHSR